MASNPRLAAGVRPAAGLRRVWRLCRSEHAKAAEFLAAQAVVQKRRQDGAVALAFGSIRDSTADMKGRNVLGGVLPRGDCARARGNGNIASQ